MTVSEVRQSGVVRAGRPGHSSARSLECRDYEASVIVLIRHNGLGEKIQHGMFHSLRNISWRQSWSDSINISISTTKTLKVKLISLNKSHEFNTH